MKQAKRLSAVAALSLACVASVAFAAEKAAKPSAKEAARIKRGEYLVNYGGCHDCHTPHVYDKGLGYWIPDETRLLSGHPATAPDPKAEVKDPDFGLFGGGTYMSAFKMSFGTVYAANLTPDKDTGLGTWTEKMFVEAIRTGRHMGGKGRAIMPPMPWMNVAAMTDEDLKSVWAYLRSIPPVKNGVPSLKVPDAVIADFTKMLEGPPPAPEAKEKK